LYVQIFDVPQYSSNQDVCQEVSAHIGTGMKDFEDFEKRSYFGQYRCTAWIGWVWSLIRRLIMETNSGS